MHELSIAAALVDTAVRAATGRKVTAVYVRCGHLRQVVPRSLEFYFDVVSRETVCEGARMELEVIPGRLRCRGCEHEWVVEQPAFRCPACASGDCDVLAGEELEVDSIDVEQEAQCIA